MTSARSTFTRTADRIAETVVESDEVALAIQSLVERVGGWEGTTKELLTAITPEKPPRDWPRSPQSLGGRINRMTPALKAVGIIITRPPRSGRQRPLIITRDALQNLVTNVTDVTAADLVGFSDDDLVTSHDETDDVPTNFVTEEVGDFNAKIEESDNSDEYDSQMQELTSWTEL